MIKIIGVKRLVILVVLVSLNAVLASAIYLYAVPEGMKVEKKLKQQQNKLTSVQRDIEKMQLEFDQLDKQQGRFDALKENGFFSSQDRADAKELFSLVQKRSRVISAMVSVKPGSIIDSNDAKKAKHKILVSYVSVDIKAFDDNDVYHYIDLVQKTFPGYMTVQRVSVSRSRDISTAFLRAIANGASPELVTAEVEFLWRTLIPEDQVLDGMGAKR